jgi:hypothetical protein
MAARSPCCIDYAKWAHGLRGCQALAAKRLPSGLLTMASPAFLVCRLPSLANRIPIFRNRLAHAGALESGR